MEVNVKLGASRLERNLLQLFSSLKKILLVVLISYDARGNPKSFAMLYYSMELE